jgi:hypothetical protein
MGCDAADSFGTDGNLKEQAETIKQIKSFAPIRIDFASH